MTTLWLFTTWSIIGLALTATITRTGEEWHAVWSFDIHKNPAKVIAGGPVVWLLLIAGALL